MIMVNKGHKKKGIEELPILELLSAIIYVEMNPSPIEMVSITKFLAIAMF